MRMPRRIFWLLSLVGITPARDLRLRLATALAVAASPWNAPLYLWYRREAASMLNIRSSLRGTRTRTRQRLPAAP